VAGIVEQAQTAVKPVQQELMPSADHSAAAAADNTAAMSVASNVAELSQVDHVTSALSVCILHSL